ncbi:hypothetical protein RSAG8_12203, partial [Rhizoctonia solani AG-8 WAC10335]
MCDSSLPAHHARVVIFVPGLGTMTTGGSLILRYFIFSFILDRIRPVIFQFDTHNVLSLSLDCLSFILLLSHTNVSFFLPCI